MSTPTSSTTDRNLEHLRRTATPLRLFQYLGPKIWGEDANLRIDDWMLQSEALMMEAFVDKARRFVGINAPPQVSKSTLVEVFFPFWVLGHWPNTRIGLIAYSDDLAQDSGSLVRDLLEGYGRELFGLTIDMNENSKKSWRIGGHRGGMLSVGIGSTITGKPMDLIIIGDVIKSMEEAASKGIKDKHWAEFSGAIRARQARTYIMAHTRFADDDLTGRIKARQAEPSYDGERWEFLSFPAIAEPEIEDERGDDPDWTDVLGRIRGEPLLCRFSEPDEEKPENWYNSHFYILKRSEDQYVWSCVYQQEPTSPKGSMFDRDNWRWFDPDDMPSIMALRRVWDLAATEGAGDWSVGQLVAKGYEGEFYVMDVWREQYSGADVMDTVMLIADDDGVGVPILIEQERSGAGTTLVEVYQRALPNHMVEGRRPDGEKHIRARPASMKQQRHRIFLPRKQIDVDSEGRPIYESPPWVPLYIEELRKLMPDGRCGRNDDQIDTLAYAVNDMIDVSVTYMTGGGRSFHAPSGGVIDRTEAIA